MLHGLLELLVMPFQKFPTVEVVFEAPARSVLSASCFAHSYARLIVIFIELLWCRLHQYAHLPWIEVASSATEQHCSGLDVSLTDSHGGCGGDRKMETVMFGAAILSAVMVATTIVFEGDSTIVDGERFKRRYRVLPSIYVR